MILKGRKVILVATSTVGDLEYLKKLIGDDKECSFPIDDAIFSYIAFDHLKSFVVYLNRGKKTRKIGFTFLVKHGTNRAEAMLLFEEDIVSGLYKRLRLDSCEYTYIEEAAFLTLQYGFRMLGGVERIEANLHGSNRLYPKLLKKLGFAREGVLRRFSVRPSGESINLSVYSILREEYNSNGNAATIGHEQNIRDRGSTGYKSSHGLTHIDERHRASVGDVHDRLHAEGVPERSGVPAGC